MNDLQLLLTDPNRLRDNINDFNAAVRMQWLTITQHSAKIKTVEEINHDHTTMGTGACFPTKLATSTREVKDLDDAELRSPLAAGEMVRASVVEQLQGLQRHLANEHKSLVSQCDLGPNNFPCQAFVMCFPAQVTIQREAYELHWYSWIRFLPVLAPLVDE